MIFKIILNKNERYTMNRYNFLLFLLFFFISQGFAADFKNILLIINYNHQHYESIPLLKKIYGNYFPNIVFYGPSNHPEVHQVNHTRGYFGYIALADAMKKYPSFDGYFFLMDDCVAHAWLFENLDTSKIWVPEMKFLYFVNNDYHGTAIDLSKGSKALNWYWWQSGFGYNAMNKSLKNVSKKYKKTLENNWGRNHVCTFFSDVLYLPARYRNDFIDLAQLFFNNKVFLELAIPTITSCISLKKDWLWLKTENVYGFSLEKYPVNSYFNHPLKLSNPTNREFFEALFLMH